jgi:hypothetical protein
MLSGTCGHVPIGMSSIGESTRASIGVEHAPVAPGGRQLPLMHVSPSGHVWLWPHVVAQSSS